MLLTTCGAAVYSRSLLLYGTVYVCGKKYKNESLYWRFKLTGLCLFQLVLVLLVC